MPQSPTSLPVLVFDFAGAGALASLVRDGKFIDRRRVLTRRGAPLGAWLEAASVAAAAWRGRYRRVAVAVPRALQGDTLAGELGSRLGVTVTALPEAQAAAWAEHKFGAGAGGDMVFLAVGLGVGGAVISGGTLLRGTHGVAGRLGQITLPGGERVEDVAGGTALMRRAAGRGARDLEGLLSAASAGASWATMLLEDAAAALAVAVAAVQDVLDPAKIVLGGTIGAAPDFLEHLSARLAQQAPRPNLLRAKLGPDAAQLGVADHDAREAAVVRLPAP